MDDIPEEHASAPRADADASGELADALSQIAASTRAALGADRVTCYSWDIDRRVVSAMYTTEDDPSRRRALETTIGRGTDLPMWRVLVDSGPVLVVSDTAADPRMPEGLGELLGAGALIGVALEHDSIRVAGARPLLGALFCTFARPRRFAPREIATARALALVASLALANTHLRMQTARSLARMRKLEAEQAALRRVATSIAAADSVDTGDHGAAAREAAGLLGVATALVIRFDGDEAVVVGAAGGPIETGWRFAATGDRVLARLATAGVPVHVPDLAELPAGSPICELADRFGFRAVAAAPVTAQGRIWGALIAAALDPGELPADGTRRLSRFADLVTIAIENAESHRSLVERSTRDALTGLANRSAFFERLTGEISRSHRRAGALSLAIIDLDEFKRVNDRFGHPTGDRVLMEFARRLGRQARAGDTLGRIGGEEFAWLMPDAATPEAVAAAERAREATRETPFDGVGHITMSAGVASLTPGMDAGGLFAVADAALYRAKGEGRDRTVAASPP